MQVASFSEENQAVNLVRRLQASGYRAYSLMVDVKGAGRRYRVRVGPYEELDDAQGRRAASVCNTSWPPTSLAGNDLW